MDTLEVKVSGTGWLCHKLFGTWIPVIQLTLQQTKDFNTYRELAATSGEVEDSVRQTCNALQGKI